MIALFTHCNVEERTGNGAPLGDNQQVRFTAGLPDTRVSNLPDRQSEWDDGDTIGVYMVDGTKSFSATAVLADNKAYRSSGAGKSVDFAGIDSANTIMYPTDVNQVVNFYAYYPYTDAITELKREVTVPALQTNLTSKTLDILYSGEKKAYRKGDGTAALRFSHKMVKLVFHITDKSSLPGDFSTGLNVNLHKIYERGTLSLTSGTITPAAGLPVFTTGAYVYVTPGESKKAIAEALVLPMEDITVDVVTLSFIKDPQGQNVYTFEARLPPVQGSNKLESGNRYVYNVDLKDRSVTISGSIEEWNDQPGPPIEPS